MEIILAARLNAAISRRGSLREIGFLNISRSSQRITQNNNLLELDYF